MSIRKNGNIVAGAQVCDSELSSTSTNPVQNKVLHGILNAIEPGAQVNRIEHVAINGNELAINQQTKTASGTLTSNSPFPASFVTNSTTLAFCNSIRSTASAVCGMTYLGALMATDMPFSGNSEVIVRIMTQSKVMVLEMFSTDRATNHWYAMYANGTMTTGTAGCPWQGIMSINGSYSEGYAPVSDYQAASKKYVDEHSGNADNTTISKNTSGALQAIALKETNAGVAQPIWVGTYAQYIAQGKDQTDDICCITDEGEEITAAISQAVNARNEAVSAEAAAVTAKNQTQALHDSIYVINNLPVGHAYNIGFYETGNVIHLTFTDPADRGDSDGTIYAYWQKTRLVVKDGGFPENEEDGTILLDNTVRDAYRLTEFTYDMGSSSSRYFALFTCSTGGTWNTQESAPRWNTTVVSFATIKQMHRSGLPLSSLGLSIGSVINVQTSDYFPNLRWKLVDEDYTGLQMQDSNLRHNSIWIPQYLPCQAGSNNALMICSDQRELLYGRTEDTVFGGGAYYKLDTGAYVLLTAGTDYNVSDSIPAWETAHGFYVYQKNDQSRANNGNNRWPLSNMMQYLGATGDGYYQPTHKFDVSGFTLPGFMGCFYQSLLECVQPVYITTAKANIDGAGSEQTLNTFWLPSIKEVFDQNNNGFEEGKQFAYFRDVATTAASRVQIDEGGTARYVCLRSPNPGSSHNVYYITASGSSSGNYNANYSYAFLPAMCIA